MGASEGMAYGEHAAIIDLMLETLRREYVFSAKAVEIAAEMHRRQGSGAYDGVASRVEFAALLTAHLWEIGRDKHLRVRYNATPQSLSDGRRSDLAQEAVWQQLDAQRNQGFARIERLAGNLGLLELRQFARPEVAGALAAATLTLLANTDALIIDLRRNMGGSPAMVALLATYFFPTEPIHLNSIFWREGERLQEWWTLPCVAGPRYLGKPVFILTSGQTFSAAEEFAYDLQVLRRAIVVGERTAGGAHPERRYQLTPHFSVNIPRGRAINPLTGTNWEGIGVIPNIASSASDAMRVAYRHGLRGLLGNVNHDDSAAMEALRVERQATLVELED